MRMKTGRRKRVRKVFFIIETNENMFELYKKNKENTNFSLHVAFGVIFYILFIFYKASMSYAYHFYSLYFPHSV